MKSIVSVGVAALLIATFARAGNPTIQATAPARTPQSDAPDRRPERPIAERSAQIRAEFETERAASRLAAKKAAGPVAKGAVAPKRPIELAADYARRMVDLAESSLRDPAARDALLWVIDSAGARDTGAYGDQFARAAALLVRHHGDDPEAVRVGLGLDNVVTPRRDALLLGFYAAAKGREAKGLARLALAEYLAKKARIVAGARSAQGRPKKRVLSPRGIREFNMTDEEYADHLELRQCDPRALQAEAERLFEEVIAEYGDVPHITRRIRKLEALLREPRPERNGKPLTAEGRRRIEEILARKKTLGQEAEARLDDMLNLVVGKPAPEIEGLDVGGKPLRLSDYRGKVVMLVFWGSWCGPCMAEVPRERDLVERLKGQPFALLGVDCEENKDTARGVMARERITWPSWFDGAAGTGPIARRYHIRAYPTVFVLDARGVIRDRSLSSVGRDDTVEKLLTEMKRPPSGQGPSRPGSEKDVKAGP